MKKKNLFMLAMGTIALSLGITSCAKDNEAKDKKKDYKCAQVTYDGGTDCFCVGEDMSQAEFDYYVSYYKNLSGYTVKLVEKCR